MRQLLLLLLTFLLTSPVWGDTVRIQGKELNYKIVDGKQLVARSALAEVFPSVEGGEGFIDLATLMRDPNARVMRRNGLIVSIRYQNPEMIAIYGPTRKRREVGGGETPKSSKSSGSFQSVMAEVVRLSNIEREKHGAPPLATDNFLEIAARLHSEEMGRLNYFSHTSPVAGRETPHERILLTGCSPRRTGENLAYFDAYPEASLAREAVVGWMNSPGHRRNLLDPGYTHIGIGVAKAGRRYYITQNFCAY